MATTDIASEKAQLRQIFRAKRKEISKAKQIVNSIKCSQSLQQNLLHKVRNKRIALYVSTRSELDVMRVGRALKQKGNTVFLPIVNELDSPLIFRQAPVWNWALLPKKKFNIPEPERRRDYRASQLDIIFTPLLAFDSYMNRLGMGGGFYDRTLGESSHGRKSNAPITIGVGYDFQRYQEKLPTEQNDFILDVIATPSRLRINRG